LAESFLLKSSPNGTARLIELLKNVSWLIKSSLEKMQLVNPLPAEFNCTQALHSMLVPAAFLKETDLCLKDLKVSSILALLIISNFVLHPALKNTI
jgi:hypothetical protein